MYNVCDSQKNVIYRLPLYEVIKEVSSTYDQLLNKFLYPCQTLRETNLREKMVDAINNLLHKKGTIMMVHCTCYSDDRQVMQYLGDKLKKDGYIVFSGKVPKDYFNKRCYGYGVQ